MVSVTNGEVRLEGEVEDLASRRLADEVATRCSGVRQVHNALRIEPVI
jgi:osmotically-inducible protein OsmY